MQKFRPIENECAPRRLRGRPRKFDREIALSQAMRLFWANGYEATSIADLTDVMGIGVKSLYAAFGSKERLYAEALKLYLEIFEKVIWDGFHIATTSREAVAAFLKASAIGMTCHLSERPRGCMVTLTFFGDDGPAELDQLMRVTRSGLFDLLLRRFQRGIDEGDLSRSIDVVALARYVQIVHSGMSVRSRDGADRAELQAIVEIAMAGWDSMTPLTS